MPLHGVIPTAPEHIETSYGDKETECMDFVFGLREHVSDTGAQKSSNKQKKN